MKTTVKIKGMHCDSCKMLIEDVCREKGTKCSVDIKRGIAVIEHESSDIKQLMKEIEKIGDYKVSL